MFNKREKTNIREEYINIINQFGPWNSYQFDFDNKNLIPVKDNDLLLRRLLNILRDFSRKALNKNRILDLGCSEGYFALELAQRGAEVLGIEGREINTQRAEFGKRFLGNKKVRFIKEDVRNLSKDKYGTFDVILVLGLLYHLDASDIFPFLRNIYQMCSDYVIIDTHIALSRPDFFSYQNKQYYGKYITEFLPGANRADKEMLAESALDNEKSFWLTRISLYNILSNVGFSTIYECHCPRTGKGRDYYDRLTLVAAKGEHILADTGSWCDLPEQIEGSVTIHPHNVEAPDKVYNTMPREIIVREENHPRQSNWLLKHMEKND
jgi:2-polyprenyl-3-methyl-5-hydroxy-6-metoxy-1,4-benzoquinol methylase